MIEITNLTFAYPGTKPIFENFSWNVSRGETWAVLGPSGCGKSTFLYLLAGLLQPTEGEVLIAGTAKSGPRPKTGLILQDYGLLPWSTARKNISLGLDIRRFYGPDGKHTPHDFDPSPYEKRIDYWLNRLGLVPHAHKYPAQMSGGQRQRVAVARTLVLEPDLLLMDEPFSSLDAPTRSNLQDQTVELSREQDLTLIIVTHSIEEAAVMGEKILLLSLPPNHHTRIYHNPEACNRHFKETADYLDLCRTLRLDMEAST
ncbi:MAG: ATP-binding cassette domain-containing protein [Candidatus Promineifilaceae bacterium]|nr:ATP-binding cassette domain-containing protein [Candidatus Promineifilaceae bacterium]